MQRTQRATIAKETVDILERGYYTAPSGLTIDISGDLRHAVEGSRLYRPTNFPQQIGGCGAEPDLSSGMAIDVTAETTLEAARRLSLAGHPDICCLNFASAKNPGGGFLSGSQAQEESLARSSGLYACIAPIREMYDYNRSLGTSLYSDYMIYSPAVPVFRNDEGDLLESPYSISIITSPAVNAGAVRQNEPNRVPQIRPTLAARMEKLLWVASEQRQRTLVLGAWGCGVFANDPAMIAELFHDALGPGGKFNGCFDRIVHAVYDRSPGQAVLAAFGR